MVIQCPACQTRFRLADEKIGPAGVSVRCSKCATTFPVQRADAPATPTVPSAPSPSPAPEAPPAGSTPAPFAPPPATAPGSGAPNPFAPPPAAAPAAQATPPSPPANPASTFSPAPAPFAAPPQPAPNPFGFAPAPNAGNPFAPPPTAAPPDPFGAAPGSHAGPSAFTAQAPPDPFAAMADGGVPATSGAPAGLPPGFGPSGLPAGIPDPFAAMADGAAPPPGVSNGPPPGMADPFGGQFGGQDDPSPGLDPNVRAALIGNGGGEASMPADAGEGGGGGAGTAPSFEFDNLDFGQAAAEASANTQSGMALEVDRPSPGPAAGPGPASVPVRERLAEARAKRGRKQRKPVRALQIKVDAPKEPRNAYRVLLGLFFVGAFAGAFASLTDGTFDPARFDRARLAVLLGPPPAAPEVAGLAIRPQEGGFLDTAPGRPRVFVANALAVNAGEAARGFLHVRGRLRDAAGSPLVEATVPCGNSFREDQLRGFRTADEVRRAYLPVGDRMSNARIEPGAAVPCTVVFFDAPPAASVADYELEIVAAKPAS